jgi:hypothetical protein
VGIGLALQGGFLNLFAGLSIIITKPFRVGEFIDILGEHGEIQASDIFTTKRNEKAGVGFVHGYSPEQCPYRNQRQCHQKDRKNDNFLLEDDRQSVPCTAEYTSSARSFLNTPCGHGYLLFPSRLVVFRISSTGRLNERRITAISGLVSWVEYFCTNSSLTCSTVSPAT